MKKIILSILIILAFPLIALADVGSPYIGNYYALISNPDGVSVSCYNNKTDKYETVTIPYDTKVYVTAEYLDLFEDNYQEEKVQADYDKYIWCSIHITDIKPFVEEYKLDTAKKADKPEKAMVFAKNGVSVYAGPSRTYKKIGTLPNGLEAEYQYYIEEIQEHWPCWIYVKSKDISGWILVNDNEVITSWHNGYTAQVEDFYDENGKIIDSIPALFEIKDYYSTSFEDGRRSYFHYKGKFGYVKSRLAYTYDEEQSLVLENDANMFSIPSSSDNTAIAIIPAGNKLNFFITYDYDFVFTEYNGIKGWVMRDSDEPVYEITTTTKKKTSNTKKMTSKDLLITCIITAVVVSVTAIVIVVLVNKKKKNKTDKKEESASELVSDENDNKNN